MTKLDEARQELGLAVLATTHGNGQEARMIVGAHEALAREIARDEIAAWEKASLREATGEDPLSPAPVGARLAPCSDKCMAGIECDNACRKDAPTPPAEGSDGGAKTGEELHAEHRRIIADLEARLAEGRAAAADMEHANIELFCKNAAAESALTDARKRIGELEALVAQAATKVENDRTLWTPEWQLWLISASSLLTAPASPETPDPLPEKPRGEG